MTKRTIPDKPTLSRLPLTAEQKAYHRARTSAGIRDGRPSCAAVVGLMQQVRLMLVSGPVSCAQIQMDLGIRYDQAKWLIRKLSLASEIVKTDGRKWLAVRK